MNPVSPGIAPNISGTPSVPPAAGVPPAKPGLLERLFFPLNPLWSREMRQQARLGRTPWYLLVLSVCLTLGLAFIGGISVSTGVDPGEIGEILFQTYFSVATFVVFLVGPAVAANMVASEREGRTWEAILLTGLKPLEIMRGKLYAAVTILALYIVFLAPAGALSFLFGGVTAIEVLLSFVMLGFLALLAVVFGLAVSSSLKSARAALIVSLLVAVVLGITLFSIFGISLSFWAHQSWANVPRGHPIWLPLAWTRASFGWRYLGFLYALPVLVFVPIFWFLYEYAHSNLTDDSDDRMSGIKKWFVVSPLAFGAAGAILVVGATDPASILGAAGACVSMHILFVVFSTGLFASEALGPSRRLLVHWQRGGKSSFRRWFGPSLAATSIFHALVLFLGVAFFLVLAAALVPGHRSDFLRLLGWSGYLSLFTLFPIGFVAWLRSRGMPPMRIRAIVFAVVALASAVPWVLCAVGGVFTSMRGDWLVVGAPSPFFAIAMVSSVGHSEETLYFIAGLACAALWALAGLLFFGGALRKTQQTLSEREAFFAREEEMLAREAST